MDQEWMDFAMKMEHHMVTWNAEHTLKGTRYLVVENFPEGATIIPEDVQEELMDESEAGYPMGLAWTKETGWVGLTTGQGPFAWYVQKGKYATAAREPYVPQLQRQAEIEKQLMAKIREKFPIS